MDKIKCKTDCFNCLFEDCINDSTYRESSLYKNRSEQAKKYQREYQKRRREKAKESGLCIVCCKKPATYGAKCYECMLRQKRHDKKKYDGTRELWKQEGRCYFCGATPVKGKKVCEKHYHILLQNIKICNESENTKIAQHNFGREVWA